jgi:hypothetical protein
MGCSEAFLDENVRQLARVHAPNKGVALDRAGITVFRDIKFVPAGPATDPSVRRREFSDTMSHVPDMHQFDSGGVAIGWLHPDYPFPQGDPEPNFLARLKEFVRLSGASARALDMGGAGGFHTCEFCGKASGNGSFGVPAGETVFFAPVMIAHYVQEHRYAPPGDFVAAVLTCPLPGTREYVAAVAPFVERQRASWMVDIVSIKIERHVALVLCEFLSRFTRSEEFWEEERPEMVALWTLLGSLESILVEPFDPKYQELVQHARLEVTRREREAEKATSEPG